MTGRTVKSEQVGYIPQRGGGRGWTSIIVTIIIGAFLLVFLVGLFDLIGRVRGTGQAAAQPTATSAIQAQDAPKATPQATASGWSLPKLPSNLHVPNITIPGISIPGITKSVVEKVECTAVDDRPGGCGSMQLGPKPEYPISVSAIEALPILYIENFCRDGYCVKVRHNVHGLDSAVPPGFEWEQKLYDGCAAKGLKLLDDDEGFYCG